MKYKSVCTVLQNIDSCFVCLWHIQDMRVLTWQFNGPHKGSFDYHMTTEDTDLDLRLWMTIINNKVTMTMPQSTLTPRSMPMIISSLLMSSNFSMMDFSSSSIFILPVHENCSLQFDLSQQQNKTLSVSELTFDCKIEKVFFFTF